MEILFSVRKNNSRNIPSRGMMMSSRVILCLLLLLVLVQGVQAAESYAFVTKWGSLGTEDGQFTQNDGVAVDSSGNVYVADLSGEIKKFSSTGTFITKWGAYVYGSGAEYLSDPHGVAVDSSGSVYVVDTGSHSLKKFGSTGTFITKWGTSGSGDGQFYQPRGVAVDSSGNVYVADYGNNRIQKFSSTGTFLAKWGSSGSGNGQFSLPEDVAVDSSGNVYVMDRNNNRIQKFSSTGTFITKWGSLGSGDGQFQMPQGGTVDSSGNVYVADLGNNRIQKFSSTGTFLAKWGSSGSGDGQFSSLWDVTVDSSGNVFVADTGNRRIQKFAPQTVTPTATPTPTPTTVPTTVPSTVATTIPTTVPTTSVTTVSTTSATTVPTTSATTAPTTSAATIQTTVPITVAPTPVAPTYVAGDIVGTSANPDKGWFVLSYDTSAGKYKLAEISQYPGGTWGYRHDSVSENYDRVLVETVFPQKFAHVLLSSIPIVTPATAQETFAATTKGTPGPTTVPTVTPTLAKNPFITITPIKDKYANEKFTITGSTNIPVDTPLQIDVTSSKQTQTGGLSGLVTGTSNVLKGIGGTNLFSFEVAASTFNPDEYTVKVSGNGGTIASTSLFNVLAGTRPGAVQTTAPTVAATASRAPATTTSPGIDLMGYAGIILIVVVIVVIAGAGIYMVKARKASSHLRVPEPPKRSTPKKPIAPQSQSRSPSLRKTGDLKFIQPETPKQLPQELSDRYTDFELIGKGGFARVFKATRTDGKQVALKIPISLDSSTGKTFIAELQNWTKLDHPNIVRVFDYNIMPLPYFEMELCDVSLAEAKIPMDCEEAAWIVFHICEGLKYAHARSIAHRDLKPQNILLKDNIPKISDWGLSRIISKSTSTNTGSFTPYYAAPEQVNNKQKDERTDIWQLGVILYELTTGILPFKGESVVDVVVGISTKSYIPPSELNLNAQQIEPIIRMCLEKDPDKRFQAVAALQTALGMYLRKNYSEMFRQSVSAKDTRRSAYYVGDLIIVNLIIGDLNAAYKYSTDLVVYAKGDTKALAQELCDHLYIRIQNDVIEVPDELMKKAEFVVHKVLKGF